MLPKSGIRGQDESSRFRIHQSTDEIDKFSAPEVECQQLKLKAMAYEIYTLGVPLEWPRRLLHIPSMTSRIWRPGDLYGNDKEPAYAILSYTWGRYEVSEGPRLDIKGIDWKVPSINPNHFTVADLTRLFQQIGLEHDYIWIDIACIDQKREKVKMEEVGRQGIIFKRARRAYIWLNKYEPEIIQQHMQMLMSCGYQAVTGNMDPLEAAQSMVDNLSLILQDPWFSSLWTLQESFLQRHATMLNKKGNPITTNGPWTGQSPNCQLLDISGACSIARTITDQAIDAEQAGHQDGSLSPQSEMLNTMRTIIHRSGIDFMLCPNPNIQYAAARFRQTTRADDRIYAIMQAYGYRLGNSATSIRKLEKFGLEELELQFLKTLNSQSSVLGQAFQHSAIPVRGQSWCITNDIRVPERLHMIVVHETFLSANCTITVRSRTEAYFKGFACTLDELSRFWQSRSRATLTDLETNAASVSGLQARNDYFRGSSRNYYFKAAKQGLMLDYSDHHDDVAMSHEWPPDTVVFDERTEAIIENRIPGLVETVEKQKTILAAIMTRYNDSNVRVLYLGRTKHIESMDVALILVREGNARKGLLMQKVPIWRRIGICFWNIEGNRGYGLEDVLEPMAGRFG